MRKYKNNPNYELIPNLPAKTNTITPSQTHHGRKLAGKKESQN